MAAVRPFAAEANTPGVVRAPLPWLEPGRQPAANLVSLGVPWPRGLVQRGQQLTVRGADGVPVPTQNWPLAFWPDGSVPWSGLAIVAAPRMAAPTEVVTVERTPEPTALVMTQDAEGITTATGAMTCRIPRHGGDLITSLVVGGREVASHGRLIVRREDRSRSDVEGIVRVEESVSRLTDETVAQDWPVRVAVRVNGTVQTVTTTRPRA